MTGLWWEHYGCGCISPDAKRRKDLPGYCPTHGESRRSLYKDFQPADQATKETHRAVAALAGEEKP